MHRSLLASFVAGEHDGADEDILHAIDHALVIEDAGEDPDRWLVSHRAARSTAAATTGDRSDHRRHEAHQRW